MNNKLFTEAIVIGICTGVVNKLVGNMDTGKFLPMFLFGFAFHLAFEFLGLNKWYCENGNACN